MLIYCTTTSVPNKGAQAEQIRGMAIEFERLLGQDFLLVCSRPADKQYLTLTMPKNVYHIHHWLKWLLLRKFHLTIRLSKVIIKKRATIKMIYTRDIHLALIALILSRSSSNVIFEAHKPISKFWTKVLFDICLLFKRFHLTYISNRLSKEFRSKYKVNNRGIVVPNAGFTEEMHGFVDDTFVVTDICRLKKLYKKTIIHTGSLPKDRGLEILPILASRLPDWGIIHVGGSEYDINNTLINNEWLNNLYFYPNTDKISIIKIQKMADYLLYMSDIRSPIHNYTSPNKVFEYLLTGKTLIAPKSGAVLEILSDKNCILFSDIEDLIVSLENEVTKNYVILDKYRMSSRVKVILNEFYQ